MVVPPLSERRCAGPAFLVETGWLADPLADPGIRVVDARGEDTSSAGHIAAAVHMNRFATFAPLDGILPRAARGAMGPPEDFDRLVGGLGIANDSTVIVYDAPSQRMGMVAWAYQYYGHADVRILDGGVAKWLAEGRALDGQLPAWPSATYLARPRAAVTCSLEQAKASVGRDDVVFWDTRSADEYTGSANSGFGRVLARGTSSGAAHLEWTELLDREGRTLKPAEALRQLLDGRGITPDKQVACSCQGGARGALGAFVLQILGSDQAQGSAGSFRQWLS